MRQHIMNMVGMMKKHSDIKATKNTLHKLSDRELQDIGINRGDINRIATQVSEERNKK